MCAKSSTYLLTQCSHLPVAVVSVQPNQWLSSPIPGNHEREEGRKRQREINEDS